MASGGDNPSMPSGIIISILKRLPIKSIVRFQCVCKDWKNLFKTKSFISEHAHHFAHENPLLLLHESDFDYKGTPPSLRLLNDKMETVEVLSIPSVDCLRNGWTIVGSSNGLICVKVNFDLNTTPHSLCLWNPMIRAIRKIPNTKKDYCGFSVFGFGFGFTNKTNDYKIVKFYNQELAKKKNKKKAAIPEHAEVYSLSTGSWKELEFGALQKTSILSKAVSADGTIFWIGVHDSFLVMVSFNIATEVFTLTPIPFPLKCHTWPTIRVSTTLGVYQNKFAIFQYNRNDDSWNSFDIWVMEEVASESGSSFSCTQEYDISRIGYYFFPICIWRNQIVCCDQNTDEDEPKYFLQLFNVATSRWKGYYRISPDYDICAGFSYERSLALL